MKFSIGLAMAALLLPMHVAASDYSALFDEAAGALDNDYESDWAFTETSVESEVTTVARYNPARPADARWNLLAVNGRSPTDEEVAEFREEKAADDRGNDDDDPENDVEELVQPDSLSLIEETDDHWLFSFVPTEDEDDEGFFEHVDAKLRIVKDGPYVKLISLQSNKPFRPQMGVKIKDCLTRLTFSPAAADGPIVPISINIRIRIRAFLFIRVDETISISYSDYEYVGD